MTDRTPLALFGLAFLAVALYLAGMVWWQLYQGWDAKRWVQVPAEVVDARLGTAAQARTRSVFLRVHARYTYRFEGRSYEGHAVNFLDRWDTSEWQTRHFEAMRTAQDTHRPIAVWVDPSNPSRSVVDRDVRAAALLIDLVLATMAGAVSLFCLWWAAPPRRRARITAA
jgi:hypothetical protein